MAIAKPKCGTRLLLRTIFIIVVNK
jgi:hypothetical protein